MVLCLAKSVQVAKVRACVNGARFVHYTVRTIEQRDLVSTTDKCVHLVDHDFPLQWQNEAN